ncbi:MAG: CoA pyrophosphatase [Beijerinckiaceae bacterium]|nr:CoA pyrophosphatase [Beijerinckiaceae bacterium]
MTSAHDLAARARARLTLDLAEDIFTRPVLPHRGDFELNPADAPRAGLSPGKPAAVLVPIVAHAHGASVLLTQRRSDMRKHPGQIAFPGGRIDEGDSDPVAAALREAHEEIALPRSIVTPLGYLDPWQTGTGYRIVPVVALVTPPFELTLCEAEVADAFETPLDFLMDPANHQIVTRETDGRRFYAMPYQQRYIWGATAGMLRNLYERLYL